MTGIACFHCLRVGHWQHNCPYLQKAADKDHHEARIATIKRRFLDEGLPAFDKQRMIRTENELWRKAA